MQAAYATQRAELKECLRNACQILQKSGSAALRARALDVLWHLASFARRCSADSGAKILESFCRAQERPLPLPDSLLRMLHAQASRAAAASGGGGGGDEDDELQLERALRLLDQYCASLSQGTRSYHLELRELIEHFSQRGDVLKGLARKLRKLGE